MKTWWIAVRFLGWMSFVTGLAYPLAVTGIAQVAFRDRANGSLIHDRDGAIKGSEWIAQSFERPEYFWPRPSAIAYDAMNSGGSQLGPTSADLATKVAERKVRGMTDDLLYASGSGLDPHVSPAAARAQIGRVATARGLALTEVAALVERFTERRQFGLLGEPRINVLRLNMALDERK